MILDGKMVFDVITDYETELFNKHIKVLMQRDTASMDKRDARDRLKDMTAAQITAVRELKDRLSVLEIKA